MNKAFIATKTYLPTAPATLVERPRLVDRLNEALTNYHKLILISAPAGSGKSTLLVDWAAQVKHTLVWLTLDPLDNDPLRFWSYVILAIQNKRPGFASDLLGMLASPQDRLWEEILPELINRLAAAPERLILIVDDYHEIGNPDIQAQVADLCEHAPAQFCLVLATRSDPPMPLHRWRARCQLTELRSSDLRFSNLETTLFLNERMGLALPADQVSTLEGRTEGWAVGLQLAALSLQAKSDPLDRQGFVQNFSANHYYVLEYLTQEIVEQQSSEVQEFLLRTCLLERLCEPLCDRMVGRPGGGDLLQKLFRANLFLTPLDDEHTWFRYHPLFADLLRIRLGNLQPENAAPLHMLAAKWYAENGWIDASLGHALAAKDYRFAADLVNSSWRKAMHEGRLRESLRWIQALPEDVLASSPLLSAAYAWNLYLLGQNDAAEPHIANTTRMLDELANHTQIPQEDPEYTTLPGQLAALKAMIASRRLDFHTAAEQAQAAIHLTPPDAALSLGPAWLALANAQRELGQFEDAILSYRQSMPLMWASRNWMGWAVSVYFQGRTLQVQGRLSEALALFQEAEEVISSENQEIPTAYALIQIGLGEIWYEWNELEKSSAALATARERDRKSGYVDMLRFGGILEGRLLYARGDCAAAVQALKDALTRIQRTSAPNAEAEVQAWLLRFQAEAGNQTERESWMAPLNVKTAWGYTRGIQALNLAHSHLTAGEFRQALMLAEQLASASEKMNSTGWMVDAGAIRAAALWQMGEKDNAITCLSGTLRLAQGQGFIRVFAGAGEPLIPVLSGCRKAIHLDEGLKAYILQMSNAIRKQPPERAKVFRLAFPLTNRELAVLRLMAEGLSNPEIAKRLYVSPGTVKTHVSHIYDKLEAQSRTEAVVKAKDLEII
jgi:LuxR family transcriptional regulator, maltose regulon positive regulatory protein